MQVQVASIVAALLATLAIAAPTEVLEERQLACPKTPSVTCKVPSPKLPAAPTLPDCSAALDKISAVKIFGTSPITVSSGTCSVLIAFANNAATEAGSAVQAQAQKAVDAINAKCASGLGSASFCGVTTNGLSLGVVTIGSTTA